MTLTIHAPSGFQSTEIEISAFSIKIIMAHLKTVIKKPCGVLWWKSIAELADALGISKSIIHYALKKIGMVNRYDIWIPHIITEKHRICLHDTVTIS